MTPNALKCLSSHLPPIMMIPGIKGSVITSFQVLVTLTSYFAEADPKTTAQYSKFAHIKKASNDAIMIPSRLGMTLIYAPAFIVSSIMMMMMHHQQHLFKNTSLATVFLMIHFAKRLLETYFVHVYSGSVSLVLSIGIGLYYAMVAYLISSVTGGVVVADVVPQSHINIVQFRMMGTVLFVLGSLGNLYHHVLLSSLRRPSNQSTTVTSTSSSSTNSNTTKKTKNSIYVAPKGGWFQYVAAPHYFFELLAWLGIAMVSQHLNVYLVFTSMCSYLTGRSVSQNRWNRHQFDNWPKDRKNLVPFVF